MRSWNSSARQHSQIFLPRPLRIGKRCIIDGLGVMLAGSTQDAGRYPARVRARRPTRAPRPRRSVPTPFRTGAASAALLNGTSGHALDWDDTQLATSADRIFGLLTHPTVPPLAAALAIGERQRVPGRQFLEAFLTGFEVECKIAEAIHPSHYKKGFHSSGTVGTFGAAAAAARLLGLDADKTAHALAIAASTASGIRVNFGTMTKPLHVGRAAQNGVVAAELAARGFTGGKDALDPPWGFFQVFSHGDGFDADRIVGKLGNPHTIVSPGVSIKPYPCGVLGHPTMDAMRRLVIDTRRAAGTDRGDPRARRLEHPEPAALSDRAATSSRRSSVRRSWSSAIALRRKAGIHEFNDAFVQSAPVQAMMRKVERVLDPEIEAKGWEKIRSTVEVDLDDGRTLVEHADERYRGGPDLPFTREELLREVQRLRVARAAAPTASAETFAMVESLEDLRRHRRARARARRAPPRRSRPRRR